MFEKIFSPILGSLRENNRLERIWLLAKVDFNRRYYDSKLGLVWALLNPLFRLIIYYFAFTYLLKMEMENYALYLFSGLLIWLFFVEGTKKGIRLLKTKKYLIENIRFNKLDLFYASIMSVIFGFVFNMMAYFVMAIFAGIGICHWIFLFPYYLLNIVLLILGFMLILATVNVYFKDIVHLWDMITLAGFWTAPIFFRGTAIVDNLPILYDIHPMSGVIENIRRFIFTCEPPDYYYMVYNMIYAIIIFTIGVYVFKKYSHKAIENI